MRLALTAVGAADGLWSNVDPVHLEATTSSLKQVRAVLLLPVDRREVAAIFAGGFLGATARAGLVEGLPHGVSTWPWATFVANVLGALALGYFTTRLQERLPLSAYRRPLLGTGLCGALTTFSTMQLELLRMLEDGYLPLALAYASASMAAGLLAVHVSTRLVRRAKVSA